VDSSLPAGEVARVAEFRAALRLFLRKSERNARQSDLTPQRYLLLLMIKGAPGGREHSTVTELAERLQLAQSTVTELVRRAEETGLVRREQSNSDGRVAHLTLTEEGERRLMKAFTTNEQERNELRASMPTRPRRAAPRESRSSRESARTPAWKTPDAHRRAHRTGCSRPQSQLRRIPHRKARPRDSRPVRRIRFRRGSRRFRRARGGS
jgi:DNA-binding MarR family transcriptional regulator